MWAEKGDKCTAFFHKIVNGRANRNMIDGIVMDGALDQDEERCKIHLKNYYKELYTETNSDRPTLDGLSFNNIDHEKTKWLERDFLEK